MAGRGRQQYGLWGASEIVGPSEEPIRRADRDLLVDLLNDNEEPPLNFDTNQPRLEFAFQDERTAPGVAQPHGLDPGGNSTSGRRERSPLRSANMARKVFNSAFSTGPSGGPNGPKGHGNGPHRESDDEMIDLTPERNPFSDAFAKGSAGDLMEPMRELPPGLGQYEDFETIDWVKEIAADRNRHRDIHKAKRMKWSSWLFSYWDSGSGWFCALLVGVIAGVFAGNIDIGSTWMSDLKEGICAEAFWLNKEQCCWSANDTDFDRPDCEQWHTWPRLFMGKEPIGDHPDAYFVGYLVYVLWAIFFSSLCVMLVKMFAPYACGSGIPEIKTILSGFVIRSYLGKWTLLVKSVGMMLAVSAGLSLGKEGPMVHMAACCGNVLSYLFPKYGRNEAKKREILSASAAAGVAIAFGAPIGGVLFSLEEASYYFPLKTMFRSFFCAMVSANVLRMMNPFGNDHLVMFYLDYNAQWHVVELVAFALLGALGGIFGAIFIRANLFVCRLRKTSRLGSWPIREVLLVTLVTSLISYPQGYLRISSSELIKILVSRCGPGDRISLCDYVINMTDARSMSFGSFPAGPGVYTAVWQLALALVFKMVITVFTFGIKVPAGLFIPSMAVGAIMGRLLGIGVEQLAVAHQPLFGQMCKSAQPCINPGLYAMVGAAACLGGVTRMTISLVVIMVELTGGLNYILPLMVAAMVSKWTGDQITSGGIYDEHIKLNNYPFLRPEDELRHTTLAADVMRPRRNDPPLQTITQDSMSVEDLEGLLASTTFNGFPVVVSHESQYLVGLVTRRDLAWALDRSRNTEEGVVCGSPVYFTESIPHDQSARPSNAPKPLGLRQIVDLSPITVTDQTPMDTVMDFFRKLGLRQALVTHNGRLLGIITKKDVLRHVLQLNNQDPASVAFS